MSRARIIESAVRLVSLWDNGEDDCLARDQLSDAVRHVFFVNKDHVCAVEQGRKSRQFGGGNFLHPRIAESLIEHLRMGFSHRECAKVVGVAKNTVHRYETLNGPFLCPCGRERTHCGWCADRIKRSPRRREFLRVWFEQQIANGTRKRIAPQSSIIIDRKVADANWPYLSGKPGDGNELIAAVNSIVPRTFADHQRADICQDLLLEILEGKTTIENIKSGSADCIKRYYKLHPGKFGPLSLDAPIPGTEGLTLADTIRDDAPHF